LIIKEQDQCLIGHKFQKIKKGEPIEIN